MTSLSSASGADGETLCEAPYATDFLHPGMFRRLDSDSIVCIHCVHTATDSKSTGIAIDTASGFVSVPLKEAPNKSLQHDPEMRDGLSLYVTSTEGYCHQAFHAFMIMNGAATCTTAVLPIDVPPFRFVIDGKAIVCALSDLPPGVPAAESTLLEPLKQHAVGIYKSKCKTRYYAVLAQHVLVIPTQAMSAAEVDGAFSGEYALKQSRHERISMDCGLECAGEWVDIKFAEPKCPRAPITRTLWKAAKLASVDISLPFDKRLLARSLLYQMESNFPARLDLEEIGCDAAYRDIVMHGLALAPTPEGEVLRRQFCRESKLPFIPKCGSFERLERTEAELIALGAAAVANIPSPSVSDVAVQLPQQARSTSLSVTLTGTGESRKV